MKKKFDFTKITTPILLELLQEEIPSPECFLQECKSSLPTFQSTIDKKFPPDLIKFISMPLWVYINLKNKLGEKKAFEIMRIALLTGGLAKQSILFDSVNKTRTFENFIKQELQINKTGTTKWNDLEVVYKDENKFEIKITKCLYHELTTYLQISEATKLICQVDNAVFNSYLPEEIIFHRDGINQRIADGCNECHFVWEYKNKINCK
ncbi:L-2-amino-thiazoline-4-carboxylic acid hydrolase [Clostridium acidisoli DSM 12555]|uniref:L-2-amino-thiazoline-4-carboxylic acid hydrolase n=1 Tax=Clostridium acidisoli DSM 12555 TaxID=1121291 RepID=A0A1W1XHT2_9CLOT|nr:L-2-amino-thiazoline-4-carboxylic acid hydrolase [Clostridium acidisoli]SMC23342.1 L-2-amino-thiazoline-4-carboxylic acid hydrolase [Clostridium acidisoli DSM 12555]